MITAANDAGPGPGPGPLALPVHRFAGQLREIGNACVRGLWQISLRMDCTDTGRSQYVTLSPGRDEAGALACGLQIAALEIGQRYHGQATLHRQGTDSDFFAGRVTLAADQRRPPPAPRLATCFGRPATATMEGQS